MLAATIATGASDWRVLDTDGDACPASHKLARVQNAFRVERVFDDAMKFAPFL